MFEKKNVPNKDYKKKFTFGFVFTVGGLHVVLMLGLYKNNKDYIYEKKKLTKNTKKLKPLVSSSQSGDCVWSSCWEKKTKII